MKKETDAKVSTITVTYTKTINESYNEQRQYEGYFSKLVLLRTLVGLYGDIILRNHKGTKEVDEEDLEDLAVTIEQLLQKRSNVKCQ